MPIAQRWLCCESICRLCLSQERSKLQRDQRLLLSRNGDQAKLADIAAELARVEDEVDVVSEAIQARQEEVSAQHAISPSPCTLPRLTVATWSGESRAACMRKC